nr:MAG TPA: hypothetical protein [Caudoviricetes sp.]
MKLSETIALFNKIRNNLPNGFYEDTNGNCCCSVGKYMIVIRVETEEYSEPTIEIELLSCLYGCFDNVVDWNPINKVEDVEKYITQFIDYIKER